MENYKEIISKYLADSTSEEENKMLLEWVNYSEKNKADFVDYCNTWNQAGLVNINNRFNQEKAYKNFISQKTKLNDEIKEINLNNISEKKSYKSLIYAISSIAAIVILFVGYILFVKTDLKINTFANNNQQTQNITLADGSIVYLYPNSTIEYPETFEKTRDIKIQGKAFISVAKDSLKPFHITAGNALIEVLGTSFDISTATDSTIVIVNTGKVNIKNINSNKNITITAGAKAICGKTSVIEQSNTDINYFSWHTGKLLFNNTPLSEVAKDIERHYKISINFGNENIKTCNLSATFENLPIEDVFSLIEMTFGLNIETKNNSYTLTGSGC